MTFIWVRNEEVFKLNNFADGEGFMPDFVLLLKDKPKSSLRHSVDGFLHYQIFIEPKERSFSGTKVDNGGKKNFLEAITAEYGQG